MSSMIKFIDAIARKKLRDVLYIEFSGEELGSAEKDELGLPLAPSIDWQNDPTRQLVIRWLDEHEIVWECCGPVANPNVMESYQGQIYIDLPYDEFVEKYRHLRELLAFPEGSMRLKNARFCHLPLGVAMRNSVHDAPPGFWKYSAKPLIGEGIKLVLASSPLPVVYDAILCNTPGSACTILDTGLVTTVVVTREWLEEFDPIGVVVNFLDEGVKSERIPMPSWTVVDAAHLARQAIEESYIRFARSIGRNLASTEGTGIDSELTFWTFPLTSKNEAAFLSSLVFSSTPSHDKNPFVITGSVESGKTHLLNAIGKQYFENNLDVSVILVSCRDSGLGDVLGRLRQADLILLDDFQDLPGGSIQTEMLNVLISNVAEQKNVVLCIRADTSDSISVLPVWNDFLNQGCWVQCG